MRILCASFALSLIALTAGCTAEQASPADAHLTELATGTTAQAVTVRFTPDLERLNTLGVADLESLYQEGTTDGGMPRGRGMGRAFFLGLPGLGGLEEGLRRQGLPGFSTAEDLVANAVWNGKTLEFDPSSDGTRVGVLTNNVLGLSVASADVRLIPFSQIKDESNTYFLDYSNSDLPLVRGIQDYMRKVSDKLYLGKAFVSAPGETRVLACYFALDFKI